MLFCRGDRPSVGILWEELSQFGEVSGLRTNALKSQVYLGGVSDRDRDYILEMTGIPMGTLPVPAGVIDRVTSLCRRFLWDGGKPLVAWRDLALPKEEGGLGTRGKW